MNGPTQLVAVDGCLFRPRTEEDWAEDDEVPILIVYPAGDCDRIKWPFEGEEWKGKLAHALYDCAEMGQVANNRDVLLPDGTSFNIDHHMGLYTPQSMEGIWY